MSGSSIKAFIGLLIFSFGMLVLASMLMLGGLIAFLGLFGIVFPTALVGATILSIVISIVAIYLGLKLFFENENNFTKAIFGIFGLILFLISVIAIVAGVFTADPLAVIAAVLMLALSVAFIGYGFKVRVLEPVAKIVEIPKKLIGVD